jgi:hypothetical protein
MPGSLSLDTHKPTHSKVKFRVPFSAERGEIEGDAERLELARALNMEGRWQTANTFHSLETRSSATVAL